MKIFNQIKDSFTSSDFEVESKMRVSELSKKFKLAFGLSLRIYKGKQLADAKMTLNTLDKRTVKTSVNFDANKMKIKASQTVTEVEQLFSEKFGITVQIADIENSKLSPNYMTLGDAKRANI